MSYRHLHALETELITPAIRTGVSLLSRIRLRGVVPAILWSLACSIAAPMSVVRADDTVVATAAEGDCTLTLEADRGSNTLRLRASHPRHESCQHGHDATLAVLSHAFDQPDRLPPRPFKSLSLGRLIDYPWLTQQLIAAAASDRGWDNGRGKPRNGRMNVYVADLLARTPAIAELDVALRKGGYHIRRLSVEKVLVGTGAGLPLSNPPVGQLPFDALVWLELGRLERVH